MLKGVERSVELFYFILDIEAFVVAWLFLFLFFFVAVVFLICLFSCLVCLF